MGAANNLLKVNLEMELHQFLKINHLKNSSLKIVLNKIIRMKSMQYYLSIPPNISLMLFN